MIRETYDVQHLKCFIEQTGFQIYLTRVQDNEKFKRTLPTAMVVLLSKLLLYMLEARYASNGQVSVPL